MQIQPTNKCFSDVIDYINWEFQDLVKRGEIPFEADTPLARAWAKKRTICHGILIGGDGKPYSHAWIETDQDSVYHFGILEGEKARIEIEKEDYYRRMKVKEVTRYNIIQAIHLEKKFGRPGPWERKYRRLCRDYGKEK